MQLEMHLCGYVTHLGESLRDVAKQFSPDKSRPGVENYLKVLVEVNAYNQGWNPNMVQSPNFPVLPGTSVCLPNPEDLKKYYTVLSKQPRSYKQQWLEGKELRQRALRSLNKEYVTTRDAVALMVRKHDLLTVGGAALWVEAMDRVSAHPEILTATGIGITAGEQIADYVKEGVKETRKVMLEAQKKLADYLQAPYGEKAAAKQAFYAAHREVKEKFTGYLQKNNESRAGSLRKLGFVNNREKWLRLVKMGAPTANVIDTEAFVTLVRVSRKAKITGGSLIAFHVALEIPEVIKTYREGGDWFKEIVKDSAGLGLSMAGSSLAAGFAAELMLTPIGWIIILAGTLGALAFEKIGESSGGIILDKLREAEHAFAGL